MLLHRLVDQLGDAINSLDRLVLRDHALLYKEMKKALAKHHGDPTLRISIAYQVDW